jgi:hypothetical protein
MPSKPARQAGRLAAVFATVTLLVACAEPQPVTVSVVALSQRPAEHALLDGMHNYESGAFDQAEGNFQAALRQGLADRRDSAVAYKHLAFIACAFNRLTECEADFKSAFVADPNFRLTDAEIGHPIWGPVYRRVLAAQVPPK